MDGAIERFGVGERLMGETMSLPLARPSISNHFSRNKLIHHPGGHTGTVSELCREWVRESAANPRCKN